MKLLFDQNLSFRLTDLLGDVFPGSSQVRLEGLDRADDLEIWRWAAEHDFCIVTLDSDFSELAALNGSPPKVVWLRCGNRPTSYVASLMRRRLADIVAFETSDSNCLELG